VILDFIVESYERRIPTTEMENTVEEDNERDIRQLT
jgi:hypothetical protein